jgi:hypothetical protein
MKSTLSILLLGLAFAVTSLAPAAADETIIVTDHGVPVYHHWQAAWDRYEYDRHHVILGTVTHFEPFRLQVARPNGDVQTIDLKNGTVILPTGTTPMASERVAVVGYWSNGTFIANRVLIHG